MLVNCTECGNKVSSSASGCPHCGFDLRKRRKTLESIELHNKRRERLNRNKLLMFEWFKRYKVLAFVLVAVFVLTTVCFVNKTIQKKRFRDEIEQNLVVSLNEWNARRRYSREHIGSPAKSGVYKFDDEHSVSVKYNGTDKIELTFPFLIAWDNEDEIFYLQTMMSVVSFIPLEVDYLLIRDTYDYVCLSYMRDAETNRIERTTDSVSSLIRKSLLDQSNSKDELDKMREAISGIMNCIGFSVDFNSPNEFKYKN